MPTTRSSRIYSEERDIYLDHPLIDAEKNIRLCKLFPGSREEPLVFTMSVHPMTNESLQPDTPYYALSYEWVAPDDDGTVRRVLVNGHWFTLGNNLWQFLLELRAQLSEELPVSIWCDAMCIDQRSVAEKNYQVGQMSLIYKQAKAVLVWLGPESHGSNELLTHLNNLVADGTYSDSFTKENLDRIDKPQPILPSTTFYEWVKTVFALPLGFELCLAIMGLLKRTYWERIWIVQEFILPEHIRIFCGGCRISNQVMDLLWILGSQRSVWQWIWLRHGPRAIELEPGLEKTRIIHKTAGWKLIRTRVEWGRDGLCLSDLIVQYGSQRCLHLHDHVYALLPLALEYSTYDKRLRVDYDCSFEDLLFDVAEYSDDRELRTAIPISAIRTLCNLHDAKLDPTAVNIKLNYDLAVIWLGRVLEVAPFDKILFGDVELYSAPLLYTHITGETPRAGDTLYGVGGSIICIVCRPQVYVVGAILRKVPSSVAQPLEPIYGHRSVPTQWLNQSLTKAEKEDGDRRYSLEVAFKDVLDMVITDARDIDWQWGEDGGGSRDYEMGALASHTASLLDPAETQHLKMALIHT